MCNNKMENNSIIEAIENNSIYSHNKWPQNATLALIRLYKSHQCLYDNTSPMYKNKFVRDLAYQEISEQLLTNYGFHYTSDEVFKKINSLRAHLRQCRTLSNYSWWLYNELVFLLPFLKSRTLKNSPVSDNSEILDRDSLNGHLNHTNENIEHLVVQPNISPVEMASSESEDNSNPAKKLKLIDDVIQKEEDIKIFLAYLNTELQQVKSSTALRHMKMGIIKVVLETHNMENK